MDPLGDDTHPTEVFARTTESRQFKMLHPYCIAGAVSSEIIPTVDPQIHIYIYIDNK